ncbi:MAG TPA: PIG-L deacetylase family protein [Ktedonobacterales bacterium]
MAEETQPKRVLIVMAHPDDGEFGSGGTLARWAAEGSDIYYCLVTDGQAGDQGDKEITSEQLAAKRRVEAQNAATALGVKNPVIFLGYPDSRLEHTLALRSDIARVIRKTKPDVVICQDPTRFWSDDYINHPDHRIAGEATMAAIIPVAGTRLAFPELAAEGLETHEVKEVYIGGTSTPNHWVDITAHIETKIAGLRAHVSQVGNWEELSARITEWAKHNAAEARKWGHTMEMAEAYKYIKRG